MFILLFFSSLHNQLIKFLPKLNAILVTLLVVLSISKLYAQPDSTWRANNEFHNRYEGIYNYKVSGYLLELVSFTSHIEEFDEDDTLKVKFYLKDSLSGLIIARRIDKNQRYIMFPKQTLWIEGWNIFNRWPVGDVLWKLSIGYTNLGVLIRLEDKLYGTGPLAPAIVYSSENPEDMNEYKMTFLPGIDFKAGRYVIKNKNNSIVQNSFISEQYGGHSFDISFSLNNEGSGWYKLIVELDEKDIMNTIIRKYDFYHLHFSEYR